MEPFKDELKLIKGWQTRVQLVRFLSWKMLKKLKAMAVHIWSHWTIWDFRFDWNHLIPNMCDFHSHYEPVTYVPYVGSVREPDYRQQLIMVSASNFPALFNTHRLKLFENFEFTFVIRGTTWPDPWLRGKCQVWKAKNAMKNILELIWLL